MPSKLPIFETNRILLNNTGEKCALIGPKGVAVLEIPDLKWASKGKDENPKTITCSSTIVQQVRWNPSADEDILAVLTTDNNIRLYAIADSARLITVCSLSNPEQVSDSVLKRRPLLASLGDTAVDFDFAPAVNKGHSSGIQETIQWPIIILRGNGDICILQNVLAAGGRKPMRLPSLIGPLPIFPSSDDNYGIDDASSIHVTWSFPPVIVIATSIGTLYHAMLLDEHNSEKCDPALLNESYSSETTLLLFERIEPELGISVSSSDNAELYACPVVLYEDPNLNSRYFCIHEAGLHIVNMPLVSELEAFVKCNEDEIDLHMPYSKSTLQYPICTRLQLDDTVFAASSPFLGFAVVKCLNNFIAILNTGEAILYALPLPPIPACIDNVDMFESVMSGHSVVDDHEIRKDNLEAYIRKLLEPEPGYSKPIFKVDSDKNVTPQAYSEFMSHEMEVLKEGYFRKYASALKEIERQSKVLSLMKEKQMQEAAELNTQRAVLRRKAEMLAERYEDLNDKQDALQTRYDKLLIAVGDLQLDTEKDKMLEPLKNLNDKIKIMEKKVEKIQKKQVTQEKQIELLQAKDESSMLPMICMSEVEQKMLQSNIEEMAIEIDNLQRKLNAMLLENLDASLTSIR